MARLMALGRARQITNSNQPSCRDVTILKGGGGVDVRGHHSPTPVLPVIPTFLPYLPFLSPPPSLSIPTLLPPSPNTSLHTDIQGQTPALCQKPIHSWTYVSISFFIYLSCSHMTSWLSNHFIYLLFLLTLF